MAEPVKREYPSRPQCAGTWQAFREAVAALRGPLERVGAIPEQPPADPRERALWARQRRNTGPAKPHNGRNTP